jgi:hypothetical protein
MAAAAANRLIAWSPQNDPNRSVGAVFIVGRLP